MTGFSDIKNSMSQEARGYDNGFSHIWATMMGPGITVLLMGA
jgi:hypothetical protein